MTDTDRLAALLHDDFTLSGFWSCVHSTENEWAPWCDVLARRLIDAGVTLAATPAPLDVDAPDNANAATTSANATPAPLDEPAIGPIQHSNSMCQKDGCTCWCQACERHNWRHERATPAPLDEPCPDCGKPSDHADAAYWEREARSAAMARYLATLVRTATTP